MGYVLGCGLVFLTFLNNRFCILCCLGIWVIISKYEIEFERGTRGGDADPNRETKAAQAIMSGYFPGSISLIEQLDSALESPSCWILYLVPSC